MSRIEIRGVIVPSNYDLEWMRPYIEKGVVTPESYVRKQIASSDTKKPLELYINSPGGSVFAAYEIINTLGAWRMDNNQPVNITVGAMAASAASAIAILSGANLKAFRNSKLMFHGAWTETIGGAEAHEDTAALLEQINADIKAALVGKFNVPVNVVDQWFAEGRQGWINSSEAVEYGMVSEIVDGDDEEIEFVDGDIAGIEANGLAIAALVKPAEMKIDEPAATAAEIALVAENPAAALEETNDDDSGKPANADEAGAGAPETEPAADDGEAEPVGGSADKAKADTDDKPASNDFEARVKERVEVEINARLESFANELKAANDAISKRDKTISEKQSIVDKLTHELAKNKTDFEQRLAAMQAALEDTNRRAAKLLAGSLTFSPAVESWPEAVAACGGDYVKARRTYPEAYESFMQHNNKRK